VHDADELMAEIIAERLVEYLERAGVRRDVQAASGPARKAWEACGVG
jgi:hypothetical protein